MTPTGISQTRWENKKNDKYVKKESYFIRSTDKKTIESFKMNKRSLNKLFENNLKDVSRILAFIDSGNLSYKDEKDVIRMLEFARKDIIIGK